MDKLKISLAIYVILCFFILYIIIKIFRGNKVNRQDKASNIIMDNLDTIYIIINSKTKKLVYLSSNVYNILGISGNNNEEIYKKILNVERIKTEIDNWDKKSNYVSQMIMYDNPKYNHDMWIKIKLFMYKERDNYYIIQIQDATKEHDSQHLLISQASNIKLRETQLNQITSKIYDAEISINFINDTYDLKYFSNNNLYLIVFDSNSNLLKCSFKFSTDNSFNTTFLSESLMFLNSSFKSSLYFPLF